ncbi:threonylcarbamoyl-AMP synthase [Patescibacteria group bacterium]|nr:threonylcarbamoyl-AMP synthase [Patescibacteria group bacterium]
MKSFREIIQNGGVGVMRTDTLYGLVCDAHNPHAVERIYRIKQRDLLKPVLILVANLEQIASFDITLTPTMKKHLDQYWPGKVSIILPANDTSVNTHYIHKGTGGIAFRIPDDAELRNLLLEVGPLIAPSANPEGQPPARTIAEAMDYFGDHVDYYMDGGDITDTRPSKIIRITATLDIDVIREYL